MGELRERYYRDVDAVAARAGADTIEIDALEDWPVLAREPPVVFPRRRRAA